MRLATCRLRCRRSCCACSKRARSSAWEATGRLRVDVRVVVATHRNLEEQVRQGAFREDLYHRVFVFPIVLPPLRERREDIRVLAEHFVRQLSEQNHWKPKRLFARGDRVAGAVCVAGKRARVAQCDGARAAIAPGDAVDAATVERALPQLSAASFAGAGNG